jgi:hypothetical protein
MLSFLVYLQESITINPGGIAQLDAQAKWANFLTKKFNPTSTSTNSALGGLAHFLRHRNTSPQPVHTLKIPHGQHYWEVTTSHPFTSGTDGDLEIKNTSGSHRPIKIEVKSGRPMMGSATPDKVTGDLNPKSEVSKYILETLTKNLNTTPKALHKLLEKEQQSIKASGKSGSRVRYTGKTEQETHHPLISMYEEGLHKSGVGVISITDRHGNIRHFSTDPSHPERLSKYVDSAHIQMRDGRLSLRISGVSVGKEKRKETSAIDFLSKQNIGLTEDQILDLHKNK